MLNFSKYYVVLIALFYNISALHHHCYGQSKPWSLKDCIDYAISNNIQVRQQLLNVRLSKDEYLRSRAALLPSVNGYATHGYSIGRTIDAFTNDFASETVQSSSFSVSGNATLFNGFQLQNSIRQNKSSYLASQEETERIKSEITIAVAQSYLQVLFSEELAAVAVQQVTLSQSQVERTRKLVDAGSAALGVKLDMEAQAAMDELAVVNTENQKNIAYLQLAQLLDIETVSDFQIVKPEAELPGEAALQLTPEQIFNLALAGRPEIKSAQLTLESAMRGLFVSRGMQSPQLSLSGSFGSGYSSARENIKYTLSGYDTIGYTLPGLESVVAPSYSAIPEKTSFNDQLNENLSKSIRLNLSIPLFNGLQVRTSISRSRIEVERAQNNLQLEKKQLFKTIRQAYADAKAAMQKYSATKKAAGAMQEAFKYTSQRFDLGMATPVEYNEAKTKLSKMQSDLLQAKYDFIFKIKVLEFYEGKPMGM